MPASYETIRVQAEGKVVRFVLHRPELRNAFNSRMIEDLRAALGDVEKDRGLRALILTGEGKGFCAGADLNWMREVINYSYEQNLKESLAIADFLYRLYSLPIPTIARVNGPAIGGGTGFLSACDIAIASEEAVFGLSEVKIGLVPAAISPYVLRRIGESRAREYFLTGERFDARRALEIGLVNRVAPAGKLDESVEAVVKLLLGSGPEAVAKCKELIHRTPQLGFEEAKEYTARMIAGLRVSAEGQEGMASFLEKRKPRWAEDL
ncbi:MAG: enoyl-CoA hydratase/isomerase family protein [Candidatus Aminicenantes bacterium]|nr:enoyl-CoA hydratase/isomerase family protein [Candidatus Aminicenantes bacterium]